MKDHEFRAAESAKKKQLQRARNKLHRQPRPQNEKFREYREERQKHLEQEKVKSLAKPENAESERAAINRTISSHGNPECPCGRRLL